MLGPTVPPPQRQQRRLRRLRRGVRGITGLPYFHLIFSDKYFSQDIRVEWAPERVVYKHTEKDR